MSGTPKWKIYRGGKNGEFIAATKYPEDAAALVALCPSDGVVKWDHKIVVWTEGAEEFPAGESYDRAAAIMNERYEAYWQVAKERRQKQMEAVQKQLSGPHSMTIEKWKG